MNKILIALTLAFGLTACSPSTPPDKKTANAVTVASSPTAAYDAISQQTRGFNVGQQLSTKVVYVVFDPKCPHCADLWNNTKVLHESVKFVWIPVALLSRASVNEGAGLLQTGTMAAMDAHEALVLAKTPVPDMPSSAENKAAVEKNTSVVRGLELEGVPYMFYKDPASGQVHTAKGGLTAEMLKAELAL